MAPADDPAFHQAMDKLLLQVNPDNILAVGRAFQDHADSLLTHLQQTTGAFTFDRCGEDPVSYDAQKSFGDKIRALFDVHWKHWEELESVVANLREVARSYGFAEEEITKSLGR